MNAYHTAMLFIQWANEHVRDVPVDDPREHALNTVRGRIWFYRNRCPKYSRFCRRVLRKIIRYYEVEGRNV